MTSSTIKLLDDVFTAGLFEPCDMISIYVVRADPEQGHLLFR